MTELVSHALLHAGDRQTALARLCRMMILVQDVIDMPGGDLLVVFEPFMPDHANGFVAFCDAIQGVAPEVVVEKGLLQNDGIPQEQRTAPLLARALETVAAMRPTAPSSPAGVRPFLAEHRAWRSVHGTLRHALDQAMAARPVLMVSGTS